jgi:SAM-dependent methyltransferase
MKPMEPMEPMEAAERIEFMLAAIDAVTARGIEIGPLTNPVVAKGSGDVRYVDHVRSDEPEAVALDDVLDGRPFAEALAAHAPFDYAVASHVLEHVPDPIAWLQDLRAVLRDGAVVSLALPDMRRGFDILREPTTLAGWVDAFVRGQRTPSPGQVFDHLSAAVTHDGQVAWGDDVPLDGLVPIHTEREALDRAIASHATLAYDDVHCWTFTPQTLTALMAALHRLGLTDFVVERCTDTVVGEFFVTLRASAMATALAPLPMPSRTEIERRLAAAELELWHASRDRDLLRAQLDRTYTTASWRLTAPIRAATHWLRQRRP